MPKFDAVPSPPTAGLSERILSISVPAPRWFFRFMYDRESSAWQRRRDEPGQQAKSDQEAGELAGVVAVPGPLADLGCGPGAHALTLARRGYEVVGLDGSPRMVEIAQERAMRDGVDVTFDVHDVGTPLPFADSSLGGALAVHVVQHLRDPSSFVAEIRRCLRPGGHLLVTAPVRAYGSASSQRVFWRLRAACYQRVPGLVSFHDTDTLSRLIESQGFTVVAADSGPARVSLLARA